MKRKKPEKGNALVRQYVLLGIMYLFGGKRATFWREMDRFSKFYFLKGLCVMSRHVLV